MSKNLFSKEWLRGAKRVLGYDKDEVIALARHSNFRAVAFITNMQQRLVKLKRENEKLRKEIDRLKTRRKRKGAKS